MLETDCRDRDGAEIAFEKLMSAMQGTAKSASSLHTVEKPGEIEGGVIEKINASTDGRGCTHLPDPAIRAIERD